MQDIYRVQTLVDGAAGKVGGQARLAERMDKSPQVISNWRHGVKAPSIEAQVDLACIAGEDVTLVTLLALIDNAPEPRRTQLQRAANQLVSESQTAAATAEKIAAARAKPHSVPERIAIRQQLRKQAAQALNSVRNS